MNRILLCVCASIALGACQPADLPPEKAEKFTEAVRDYYLNTDIGGGFFVGGFRAAGPHIEADLYMSDREQACGFKQASTARRDLVFSMACPFADDAVWDSLDPGVDIRLVVSCRGQEFVTHSCRRAHRKGTRDRAPSQENPPAMADESALGPKDLNLLGMRYSNGEGVPQDVQKARDLFTRAAIQGFAPAQGNIAMHLLDTEDINVVVSGYAWAILAGRSDNEFAASIGRNVSEDYVMRLSPEQQAKALEWADSWVVGQDIPAVSQ